MEFEFYVTAFSFTSLPQKSPSSKSAAIYWFEVMQSLEFPPKDVFFYVGEKIFYLAFDA